MAIKTMKPRLYAQITIAVHPSDKERGLLNIIGHNEGVMLPTVAVFRARD